MKERYNEARDMLGANLQRFPDIGVSVEPLQQLACDRYVLLKRGLIFCVHGLRCQLGLRSCRSSCFAFTLLHGN